MTLPNGKRVTIQKLGEGEFARAFKASDGWVYAFLKPEASDPTKELVMDVRDSSGRKSWRKHLPRFAFAGWSFDGDGKWQDVYRSPFYYSLRSPKARKNELENYQQIKRLRQIRNETYSTFDDRTARDRYTGRSFVLSFMDHVKPDKGLSTTVRGAILELCRQAARKNGDWRFEFPDRNLAVDDKGVLILLDVMFDADAKD